MFTPQEKVSILSDDFDRSNLSFCIFIFVLIILRSIFVLHPVPEIGLNMC
uniref:Uncharacterized protein n=1 Tax=Anguilla anguilla TaxID=7936 RepID=A0A0E9RK27_ANGAN